MKKRYFYHSFPRRAGPTGMTERGCNILAAIRDSGLLLMPEYIEWKQPSASGEPRIFPVLQRRVCFTELSPAELPEHATRFGLFALEFEIETLRRLGAIPVFYIPQPTTGGSDGNAVGVGLLGIAMDASVVVNRLAVLDGILNGTKPVADQLAFNVGFAREPDRRGNFALNSSEAKNLLTAVGHAVTPWSLLDSGMTALMNFFYPADNTMRDRLLEYYRQREWRIACGFAINGVEVLRLLTPSEKARFTEIDPVFFGRQIRTDLGLINALDQALIHPGLGGRRLIEMARRVAVPPDAIEPVTTILAVLSNPPKVVAIDKLADDTTS